MPRIQITIIETHAKSVLTRTSGFLKEVSSHSLQPYRGCTFGNSLCGVGCYVRSNGNVLKGREWGDFLEVRVNAADVYRQTNAREKKWANGRGREFAIFMSSSTEPFLPQEFEYGTTRSVLEAMIDAPPDVLILQTHTHQVTRYLDLYSKLAKRCKLRFHLSIETDRQRMPDLPPHASPVERRLEACEQLRRSGHFTVVTVSPLLPIDDPDTFFKRINDVADAVVLDHFIMGDGTPTGTRTLKTRLPASMALVEPASVSLEYRKRMIGIARRYMPGRVGVSADGFAGIYN
jgi:DNA repair photolyase